MLPSPDAASVMGMNLEWSGLGLEQTKLSVPRKAVVHSGKRWGRENSLWRVEGIDLDAMLRCVFNFCATGMVLFLGKVQITWF